jgi:hypothetical protein
MDMLVTCKENRLDRIGAARVKNFINLKNKNKTTSVITHQAPFISSLIFYILVLMY